MTFAVITKDLLSPLDGPYAEDNLDGRFLTKNHDRPDDALRFRLLDDDRIPYFEGEATDDILEQIMLWGERGFGCTILQTRTPADDGWEDCIG